MRWAALAAIVGLHLLALPQVFQDIPLHADSDTAVMLDAVQRYGALRWLVGDWLLENGFYRPVSSPFYCAGTTRSMVNRAGASA
jgi:hypothetical protein